MSFLSKIGHAGLDILKTVEPFIAAGASSNTLDPFHRICYLVLSAEAAAEQVKAVQKRPVDKQKMILDDVLDVIKGSALFQSKTVTSTVGLEAAARTIIDGVVLALKSVDVPPAPPKAA
jgi:hypothetical protein